LSDKTQFEDYIDIIEEEILKRKSKWSLNSIAWMDFEDVSQIIKIHIYKKWHLYNHSKPLRPWLNRIISNQLKNLIRNNYGNFAKPCVKCAASNQDEGCLLFKKQCNSCPLYEHWSKNKKDAHGLKSSGGVNIDIDNNLNASYGFDHFESNTKKLHEAMLSRLKPLEKIVYTLVYIENKSDKEVAKIMNYKTTEKGRQPGYKHIKNLKKSIIEKVKKALKKGEIDLI
jgi:RNA polymerase sigma factor (sigma-70 family)